jgi:hypothetical protein
MKQGYVIAQNNLVNGFFTASSAYDRPQWRPVNEATIYASADLANQAMKKLLKNGSYSSRIVALSELYKEVDMEPHNQQIQAQGLPPSDELGDEPGMEAGTVGDEEHPEDEMTADATEEVCPECEHEPCTCEHNDEDSDEDDTHASEDENGDITIDFKLGGDVNGGPDENEQEADPRFDGRRLGMVQMSPMGAPRKVGAMESATMPAKPLADAQPSENDTTAANQNAKIDTLKIADPAQTGKDENSLAADLDAKVKIPADVTSELKATIAKFDKQAELSKTSDDAGASFCMTVADALRALEQDLSAGTVGGVKQAQIHLSTYMSPITSTIPAIVLKFINKGGEKQSLKDMFNAKRDEKKA